MPLSLILRIQSNLNMKEEKNMNIRKITLCWSLFLLCFGYLFAEDSDENLNLNFESNSPIFVSLGCQCEVAHYLRHHGRRISAFPFDWIVTANFSYFQLLLQEDFKYFLDQRYLVQHPDGSKVNTYYNINFRHDWPTPDLEPEQSYAQILEKYQRRIKRFYDLNQYKGKVYFIRASYHNEQNLFVPTATSNDYTITDEQIETLYQILCQKFPDLDFCLIVTKYIDILEERAVNQIYFNKILEFKMRKMPKEKEEDYQYLIQFLENNPPS